MRAAPSAWYSDWTRAAEAPLLMLVLGVYLVFSHNLSLGTMLGLIALAGAALAPVAQLGRSITRFQTIRVHLSRLRDVAERAPESLGQGAETVDLNEPITLTDVSFSYSGDGSNALSDISLTVRPGEKIAIVGSSGSGKATNSSMADRSSLPAPAPARQAMLEQ